jgi:hypothetical protein
MNGLTRLEREARQIYRCRNRQPKPRSLFFMSKQHLHYAQQVLGLFQTYDEFSMAIKKGRSLETTQHGDRAAKPRDEGV